MSLIGLRRIADYWSQQPFLRQEDFPLVMDRNQFEIIWSALQLNFQHEVDERLKYEDLLCKFRSLFGRFQQRCQNIIVPSFCSTLDENSVHTKARTREKLCIPNKPDKFAICFYCIVDWRTTSIHRIFDKSTGEKLYSSAVDWYTSVFNSMENPAMKFCTDAGRKKPVRGFWKEMTGQKAQRRISHENRRILFQIASMRVARSGVLSWS